MNRLQKKCFIASVSLHGLLLLTLVFGAALMPKEKETQLQILTVYDARMVTDAMTSGGTPTPATPPPAPNPPQPAQTPELPTPPPQTRNSPRPVEPPRINTPARNPNLRSEELQLTQRNNPRPPQRSTQPDAQAQAQEQARRDAANRRAAQNRIDQALRTINNNLSSSTQVESPTGPGGAGPAMANYNDIVGNKYRAAWNPPASLDDESATVTVSVVIYRDGRVKSHSITKSSGNAAMDRSIEATLDNVTVIEPFPAESRDLERTFIIKFNLAAKRSLG